MSFSGNPFIRGYQGLNIQRTLVILLGKNYPPARRLLHPSQTHLSDDRIAQKHCLLSNEYAIVTGGQRIPKSLRAQCDRRGFVIDVQYAIQADDDGQPVSLGLVPSREQADEIIRRMRFETGVLSRCWEISRWHLDFAALRFLEGLEQAKPIYIPFCDVFRLRSDVTGIKLIGTPWNDEHLRKCGATVLELRKAHLKHGMPPSLLHVLHLAGQADIRILIFDGGAPLLEGLMTYDHD
jgi:hypothetical protein